MAFFESSSRSIFLLEHDLFRKPVSTFRDHALGGRFLDDHGLAGIDDGGVRALELLHAAVIAARPVLSDLTGLAAGQAERPHAAVTRENRAVHLLQEADGPADAVAG